MVAQSLMNAQQTTGCAASDYKKADPKSEIQF